MNWHDAVVTALHRFSSRNGTRLVDRQSLIKEELPQIIGDTDSQGQSPSQIMSRVLQELRDEGILYFTGSGKYFLLDTPVQADSEDLPEDAIDQAIREKKLILDDVPTSDMQAVSRRRVGQARVRQLTLQNYDHQCGLCDVRDERILVASHIARWADEPNARGNLSNVICLCQLHDPLFEAGYLAISDNWRVLKKRDVRGEVIVAVMRLTQELRMPAAYPPAPEFLKKHRIRTGFQTG